MNKNQTEKFHTRDILSTYTGIVCGSMDGVYKVLNFMTNDKLTTFQLVRVADEVRPYLAEQLPWLKDIDPESLTGERNAAGVQAVVDQYGEYHEIFPIHPEDHERIHPVDELKRIRPDVDIIEINVKDDTSSEYGDINWASNNGQDDT